MGFALLWNDQNWLCDWTSHESRGIWNVRKRKKLVFEKVKDLKRNEEGFIIVCKRIFNREPLSKPLKGKN